MKERRFWVLIQCLTRAPVVVSKLVFPLILMGDSACLNKVVVVKITIAVIKHYDETQIGQKRSYSTYTFV